MNILSYGDEVEKSKTSANSLELLVSDDRLSANSINRTIQNIYEDEEASYAIIQNLIKNIYGREDGILPNVYEEFNKVRILDDGAGNSYIRIPFGAINLKQPHDIDSGMSYGLSYSGVEEDGSEKKFKNKEFINDGFDSYTIINKPKIGLAKRQIANTINLDIKDLDNDVKISFKKFDSIDEVGLANVYKIANGNTKLEVFNTNGGLDTEGNEIDSNLLSKLDYPFIGYNVSIVRNSAAELSSDIYTTNIEEDNFPNKAEDTSWIVAFPEGNLLVGDNAGIVNFSFVSEEDSENVNKYLQPMSFIIGNNLNDTINNQINNIVSDINASYSDYYSAEKTSVRFANTDVNAIKITSKINYSDFTDKTRIVFYTGNSIPETADFTGDGKEGFYKIAGSGENSIALKTIKAQHQGYYYDSISLLQGIISKYSSYVVSEKLAKDDFLLEELVPISLNKNKRYCVYFNSDFDDKYLINGSRNDKSATSSKMFGCVELENDIDFEQSDVYLGSGNTQRDKPIKIFEFETDDDALISSQHCFFDVLDASKINTRALEIDNLLSNTKSVLKNEFCYTDEGYKNKNKDGEVTSKRGIKSLVSRERNSLSSLSEDNGENSINAGTDDIIDIYAPNVYIHSYDGNIQEVIRDTDSDKIKRLKLKNGAKLRIEQQNNKTYDNLNLIELANDYFKLERREEQGSKIRNIISLINGETKIASRNSGVSFVTDNYETESMFKIYVDENKSYIKGTDGKIVLSVNTNGGDTEDFIVENGKFNYNKMSVGNIDGALSETDSNKKLIFSGDLCVGNENNIQDGDSNKLISLFNSDAYINGKLCVKNTGDENSYFILEKDNLLANNYNEVLISGNIDDASKYRYKFAASNNNKNIEITRWAANDNYRNSLLFNDTETSLRFNCNETIKEHYFKLNKNLSEIFIRDNLSITLSSNSINSLNPNINDNNTVTITIGGNANNYRNVILKQEGGQTFLSSNISNVSFAANSVTISNEGAANGGNLTVNGKTIFGQISDDVDGQRYNSNGIAIDDENQELDYELFVGGRATLQKDFAISDDISFNGSLIVNGATIIKGELTVEKDSKFNNGLSVDGEVTLNNTLSVRSSVELNGGLEVSSKVAEFNNGLSVDGNVTFKNNVTVTGNSKINNGLTVTGDRVYLNNGLTVTGASTLNDTLDVTGDAYLNNGLTVTGDITTLKNGLSVNGTATVDGAMTVSGGTATGASGSNTVISGAKIYVGNGGTTINGGEISCTSVTTTSSRTKKNSIIHSERKAVKAINDIEIVDFFYNNDKGKRNPKVGFIAEDTDSLFSTNNKDCMDHSNCIGMLLKAIQELSAEIEELKKNR